MIIYNTKLVSQDQRPTSVRDLADPRFRGKACLANPLFGTTSMHAAALFQVLGDDAARRLLDSLAANDGMGTLVVPNAVVLIAGGPNAENGKRFIDYLLRPETEAALASSDAAQMPLRSDVELPGGFPFQPVSQLKAIAVDYHTLAGKLEELSRGFLKQWMDQNQ